MENSIITKYGKIKTEELDSPNIPNYPSEPLNIPIADLYDKEIDERSSQIFIKTNKEEIPLNKINNLFLQSKEINYFFCKSSPHKITIPKTLTPKLAYVIGYIYGDGGLKDIWKSYRKTRKFEHKIIIGDEFKLQIEKISNLLKEIFNIRLKIRTERKEKGINLYYINPTCKVLYRFLTKIFELPCGPKCDKIRTPNIIKKSNKEIKLWFIKGFMDADGDTRAMEKTRENSPSPRIKIRLCSKEMIEDLQEILNKKLNLNFTGPYSDNPRNYYIQTAKKGSTKAQKIELFNHPIKKWRLDKMILTPNRSKIRHRKV